MGGQGADDAIDELPSKLNERPDQGAGVAVRHKNRQDIRVPGKRSDPGDFPVLHAVSCFP